MFSVLIPLTTYAIVRPKLDWFFRWLLLLFVLFGIAEIASYITIETIGSNLLVYYISSIIFCIILSLIWYNHPNYSKRSKKGVVYIAIINIVSILVLTLMFNDLAITTKFCINQLTIVYFVYSIQYFIHTIRNPSERFLLMDPYLIVATAFFVYALSTCSIFVALEMIPDEKDLRFQIYLLRQIFYLVFNVIIAYSVYILARQQQIDK